MTAEKNNNPSEISQFLDQFERDSLEVERAFVQGDNYISKEKPFVSKPAAEKDASFKKLEEKIGDLERKFDTVMEEKQALAAELSKTKETSEKTRTQDEFLNNIFHTINSLKESVDRLSHAAPQVSPRMFFQSEYYAPGYYYGAPMPGGMAKPLPPQYQPRALEHADASSIIEKSKTEIEYAHKNLDIQKQEIETQRRELEAARAEKAEQEKLSASLLEKASRLKAVNSAMEREFKRVQSEKIEALRKSAEQAKEILSLREQLTRAEEKFKSFDFESRIISIRNHYQQKVSKLEAQLREMSAVCMTQVEEIENLKAENLKLSQAEEQHIALQIQYEAKVAEASKLQQELERVSALKGAPFSPAARKAAAPAAPDAKTKKMAEALERKDKELSASAGKIRQLQSEFDKVSAERDALEEKLSDFSAHEAALREEKHRFEETLKHLNSKMKGNDSLIEEMKKKIEVLSSSPAEVAQKQTLPERDPEDIPPAVQEQYTKQMAAMRRAADRARKDTEGKNFLSDTQSFLGRLRWSLLKDD